MPQEQNRPRPGRHDGTIDIASNGGDQDIRVSVFIAYGYIKLPKPFPSEISVIVDGKRYDNSYHSRYIPFREQTNVDIETKSGEYTVEAVSRSTKGIYSISYVRVKLLENSSIQIRKTEGSIPIQPPSELEYFPILLVGSQERRIYIGATKADGNSLDNFFPIGPDRPADFSK